jgi:hypothetical protein
LKPLHNVVSSTPRHERGLDLTILVVIGTDCTGSCEFNYHTITTMMAPIRWMNVNKVTNKAKCALSEYFTIKCVVLVLL